MDNDRRNLLKGYNLLLYFAGSMLMSEPTEECVIDFWRNGALKSLPVSSSNPRFIKAAGYLRESCSDETTCRNRLINDYTKLFDLNKAPLAPAYESVYSGEKEAKGSDVTKFYSDYGWLSRPTRKVTDDHLGIELLFLTKLVDRYMTLDDEPCRCEMRNEITRYIDQHIISWIPQWYNKVEEHASSLCYKGIGLLIYACVEDLKGIFSGREDVRNSD